MFKQSAWLRWWMTKLMHMHLDTSLHLIIWLMCACHFDRFCVAYFFRHSDTWTRLGVRLAHGEKMEIRLVNKIRDILARCVTYVIDGFTAKRKIRACLFFPTHSLLSAFFVQQSVSDLAWFSEQICVSFDNSVILLIKQIDWRLPSI